MTVAAVLLSLCGYAQTQGTSTVGLGFNSNKNEYNYVDAEANDLKQSSTGVNLGYGFFVKDNVRLGIDLSYSKGKSNYNSGSHTESESYGAALNYQRYFPLIGKFYAFAGGRASYRQNSDEQKNLGGDSFSIVEVKGNLYGLNAVGGLSWFFAKRWALETQLLSAGASYGSYKSTNMAYPGTNGTTKQTSFNLSSGGLFNETSFKIYFLF